MRSGQASNYWACMERVMKLLKSCSGRERIVPRVIYDVNGGCFSVGVKGAWTIPKELREQ